MFVISCSDNGSSPKSSAKSYSKNSVERRVSVADENARYKQTVAAKQERIDRHLGEMDNMLKEEGIQ